VAACGDRPVAVHDAKSLGAVPPNLAHDTMVAAYLLDPAGRAYPFDEVCADRGIDGEVGDDAARDAVLVRVLTEWQREALRERGIERLLDEVELPLVHVLRAMELAGLKLDTERLAAIAQRVRADSDELEREIHALAGEEFTIGSPQQLSEVLFVKLGLSRKRRGKTGYSTDARVLQAIRAEHEIVPKIERWRELTKLTSTYLEALPQLIDDRDGRLHTTFNQTATTTGRLSSTDPNLQNIPIRTELGREIRACFVAEPGNLLVSADYSQVELRVLAHIAEEPVLKEIFARGEDVHTATAGEMLGLSPEQVDPGARSKAKMINYGIVYGLSGFGLADRLQIEREEADAFIERYLDRFPKVREFIDSTIAFAAAEGYVSTLLGRRRLIPELRARNRQVRQLGERLAVNTVIQGSAADIIKLAMVHCHRALQGQGLTTRLILQIHDELLFEGPAGEAEAAGEIVRTEMEGAYDLDPPLAVDLGIGPNWLEAK
jgi:DNA polymerase-1